MFFKKNVAADDVAHHARMSESAVVANVVAFCIWMAVFGKMEGLGLGVLAFAPFGALVFIAAPFVRGGASSPVGTAVARMWYAGRV